MQLENQNLTGNPKPKTRPSSPPAKAAKAVWRFLTSVRLTIALILILGAFSLIGVLVIQVPAEFSRGSADYLWWLDNVAEPKYGIWAGPMEFFQLFDVFHSFWFLGAGFLLVVNIVACNIKRWRSVWAIVSGGLRVKHGEPFYDGGRNLAQLHAGADPPSVVDSLIRVLRRRGYGARTYSSGKLYLSATKNRFSPLATYLVHLSLILLVVGFLITGYLGFRDTFFVVAEGSQAEVGHGTSLTLYLEDFSDDYWPDGTPKDYRSEVILYESGEEVKQGTIRVNHPMNYEGVRFYQSFFGPAAVMTIKAEEGEVLYQGSLALFGIAQSEPFQRPVGSLLLDTENLVLRVIGPALNMDDPSIAPGELGLELYDQNTALPVAWTKLAIGTPTALEGLQISYDREASYAGFQVSRDPGGVFIWVASALFLLGLGVIFYLPRRQLWAKVEKARQGSRISLRWAPVRGPGRKSEFQRLVNELQDTPGLNIEKTAGDSDD
jgi:cytochrome c biogenesis protein